MAPQRPRISQDSRILLYLEQFGRHRDAWEVPFEISQEGIAKSLGMILNNVSRSLASLQQDGLVEERLAHVRGAQRRRKAYFLSQAGQAHAARLIEGIAESKAAYVDESGKMVERTVSELMHALLSQRGIACTYFEVEEFLQENRSFSVLDLERSLRERKAPGGKLVLRLERAPKLSHFYGRAQELAEISECIDGGTFPIIVVHGIAGIGKSTLAAKTIEKYRSQKNIFWYRFHEWDSVRSVALEMAEFFQAMGRGKTAACLRGRGQPEMNELAAALDLDLLESNSILFFDDMHRACEQMRPLLSALVEIGEGLQGAHLVFLTREVVHFYDRRETLLKKTVREIQLSGLDRESSRQLISFGVTDSQAAQIFEATKGHPLFLELLNSTGNFLLKKDIDAFINEEIYSKLLPQDRAAVEGLSVYRYPVPIDALQKGATFDLLSSLARRSLVRDVEGQRFELHDILREFVYRTMQGSRLAELHRAAARYYMDREPVRDFAEIEAIYHLQKAGKWREAGALAIEKLPGLIGSSYSELMEVLCTFKPQHLPKEQWADLLFLKAEFHIYHEEWYLALNNYLECLAVGESLQSEPKVLADIHSAIAEVQAKIETWESAKSSQMQALELFRKGSDLKGIARASLSLGVTYRRNKEFDSAQECYDEAKDIFTKLGDRKGLAAVYNNYAFLELDRSRWTCAIEHMAKSLQESQAAGDMPGQALAHESLADMYRARGKFSEALESLQQSAEIHKTSGDRRASAFAMEKKGDLHLQMDEMDDALDIYGAAAQAVRETLSPESGTFWKRAQIAPEQAAAAQRALSRILGKMAGICRTKGDFKAAKSSRDGSIEAARESGDAGLLARAIVEKAIDCEEEGDMDFAITFLKDALSVMGDGKTEAGRAQGPVIYSIGRLLQKANKPSEALEYYRKALDASESAGDRIGAARSSEKIASLLKKARDPKAEQELRKAIDLYRQAGLPADARRLQRGAPDD